MAINEIQDQIIESTQVPIDPIFRTIVDTNGTNTFRKKFKSNGFNSNIFMQR